MRLAARLLSTSTGEGDHCASLRDGPSGLHGCAPNDKAALSLAAPASRSFTLALRRSSLSPGGPFFPSLRSGLKEKNAPPGRQRKKQWNITATTTATATAQPPSMRLPAVRTGSQPPHSNSSAKT